MLRSFHHGEFTVDRLLEHKRGRRVSVCLPARDEAATVGHVVGVVRSLTEAGLVDDVVVIDDGSTDATAVVARAAGARVFQAAAVLPEYGSGAGKGQALWKAVHVAHGDLIAFCDADVTNFHPGFVLGLLGPLLVRDDVVMVKGFYRRPIEGQTDEGGRVTELMARPLLSLLFPHLAPLMQPLAGECAAPREVFEQVPFVDGYGVDLGLMIDVAERFGIGGIVQCDLGTRIHRNRPLSELSLQATAILQLALSRAGAEVPDAGVAGAGVAGAGVLLRPGAEPAAVSSGERPPLVEVPAHRKTA